MALKIGDTVEITGPQRTAGDENGHMRTDGEYKIIDGPNPENGSFQLDLPGYTPDQAWFDPKFITVKE